MIRRSRSPRRRCSSLAGRTIALALASAGSIGCTSMAARLDLLEDLHADDGSHKNRVRSRSALVSALDSALGVVRLAPERAPAYETVENPAAACRKELHHIGGYPFDSPAQLGFAVALLSRIASRDRSHVSRSHAIFSLRQIALNWLPPAARRAPFDAPDPASGKQAFDDIRAVHGNDGRHRADDPDAEARCAVALRAAAAARFANAAVAREILRLFATFHRVETAPSNLAAIEEGLPRLAAQVVLLTHLEALSDDRAYVRRDAADGLGLLECKEAVMPLAALLVRDRDSDPVVRWSVLRALGRLRDPRALPPVLEVVSTDSHPTTRHAAFEALRSISGKAIAADADAWRRWMAEAGLPAGPSGQEPER